MFVASRVEFGDGGEAVAALLPRVIGNIQTVIGGGTLARAGGIAAQVLVGAPVCQGDVIETAADGRIEIRFIDGTVFTLSRDTRVVLSEFDCDPSQTGSARFAVTKGIFAFVAGRVAKSGSLWVDTPVGSIRSRAPAGGFGMLSLAALTFAMMEDAHAADPSATFLDDDNITYRDLEHGIFELITKEAIPQHIFVEDPGETVVITRKGSSVSVSEVANSASRMEDLHAAQQELLANLTKIYGGTGSGTPPSIVNPELLQPINFIQTDPTHGQNSLPPIEPAVFKVPEIFILPPPPPTLAITSVGGQIGVATDDLINVAKANAGVAITGTTSGVEDGRIVTVTIVDSANHVVYSGTATVTSGGWSINVSSAQAKGLADGFYTLTADTSNAAGDPANASQTIKVDETPPTIAIDTIVRNDVVNANAASAGFAISGTSTDAENGQPVTVKIVDSSGQVVETFTTTLTNNTWSVNVSSAEAKLLHDGSYTVTADVSDAADNPAPQATQALTVDETPPTVRWLPQAESGVEGTAIALGAITASANSLPGHINGVQSLVVSGVPVGSVLTDGTNNFMATSGNTSVDVNSWNFSNLKITPPNDANFTLTVTATDQDANVASASELVAVAPLAPDLNPVAAQGIENTAIALDLGAVARSLSGTNGDASANSLATLVVSDIPAGATLSDGTGLPGHSFTATADNASFDVAGWSLSSLTITPPAELEGSFTLTIAASERDSEGNISATVTATEVVTVAPVAREPTANAPATLTLNENDKGTAVAGVSVGPPAEDGDDTVSATLAVSQGTLHVGTLIGVTVSGDDSATLTLSGSAADVNSLLAGLTYTPTAEFEGADALHLSVTSSDGSNASPTTATASTVITVKPIAEPPTAHAPETLTLNENATGVALGGVSVGPLAEDSDDTVSATLAVSQGTLHVGSLIGVTVSGDDSATLTLSGSAADVNSLLAGLTYTPTAEYEGSDTLRLSVTSSDGSNTDSTAATASTMITVKAVADPPTAKAPATLTLNENATAVAVAGVSVGPLAEDGNDTVSATLTVSHGTLDVGSLSGVTVSGDDSATLTLSGDAAAVNSLLVGLTYTPTGEYEGSDTLHLSVTSTDGSNTSPTTATASTAITVKAVAEPPTANAPATLTFEEEDGDTIAVAGVSVGPLAEDNNDTVSATLTVSHGTLHVGSLSGVTVTGDDSATLTLSGSAAAVNTLLAGLTYTSTEEFVGIDTLHLSVTSSDGSNTYPTPATASTVITVDVESESLIVGGPGPTLAWNDPANWSAGIVPTLSIDVTINAPSNYTVAITGTPIAQAESLTIPHGAATTDVTVSGTLQLAGNLNVSDSVKLENDGTLEELANASFIGPIINNGTIIVDPNVHLEVAGTITGIGNFWIDSGATLEFELGSKVAPGPTDSQLIYFEQGAGKLIIDDWGKFAGVITGTGIGTQLTTTDFIDLTQLRYVGGSMSVSVSYNSGTNISTMTFSDGISANNVTLHLSGNYTSTAWSFTSINGGAGTEISDPPISASQTFTSSPTRSGSGSFTMTAASALALTLDTNNNVANALNNGGFGGDTINANNGNDIVISVFGADLFASDRLDSNAAPFDTITNFVSGSDKIDLTALGTLASAILALTPTSTAVPAHTIAWLHESTTNETIVYVNPTDQALRIGDSGLREIHVQGVTTMQSSDFIHAPTTVVAAGDPFDLAATTQHDATIVTTTADISSDTSIVTATTADVSSDATVSHSALFADLNWTAQTTGIGDRFDGRDQIGSIDHAKFAALDESGTVSSEHPVEGVVMTPPSGLSIELPHAVAIAPMQTSFATDQKPVSDNADLTTIDHGAVTQGPAPQSGSSIVPAESDSKVNPETSLKNEDHQASIPKNAGPTNEGQTDAQEKDTAPEVVRESGFLKTPESDDLNRSIASEADEHGAAPKHGASEHGFEPSFIEQVVSQVVSGGTVDTPEDSFHFKHENLGIQGSGLIDVAGLDQIPASTSHHDDTAGTHVLPAISEGEITPDKLGDSFHFKDQIPSSKSSGLIDVAQLDQIPASIVHHGNGAATQLPSAISDAAPAIELPPPGQDPDDHLHVVPDHARSALLTHAHHDLIV
jgi:hypothetical protein